MAKNHSVGDCEFEHFYCFDCSEEFCSELETQEEHQRQFQHGCTVLEE